MSIDDPARSGRLHTYNIPYWRGYAAGEQYADFLIKKCHEENHPKMQTYPVTWCSEIVSTEFERTDTH